MVVFVFVLFIIYCAATLLLLLLLANILVEHYAQRAISSFLVPPYTLLARLILLFLFFFIDIICLSPYTSFAVARDHNKLRIFLYRRHCASDYNRPVATLPPLLPVKRTCAMQMIALNTNLYLYIISGRFMRDC